MRYFYLHGFASGPNSKKARYFKNKLAQLDLDLVVLDLNQNNFSQFTVSAAVSYVLSQLDEQDTCLIGSSLGGLIALLAAEKNPVIKHALLLAPAIKAKELWREIVGLDNLARWQQDQYLPINHIGYGQTINLNYEFIRDLECLPLLTAQLPSLIFHGIHDLTIPLSSIEDYLGNHPQAYLIQLLSDHGLEDSLDIIWHKSQRFLTQGIIRC